MLGSKKTQSYSQYGVNHQLEDYYVLLTYERENCGRLFCGYQCDIHRAQCVERLESAARFALLFAAGCSVYIFAGTMTDCCQKM